MMRINLTYLFVLALILINCTVAFAQETKSEDVTKSEPATEQAKPVGDTNSLEYKIFELPRTQEGLNPIPYKKIGITLFGNNTRIWEGDKQFSRMLLGYSDTRFKGVEFVKVARLSNPDSTMLFDEARQLGEQYGVDAIITGVLDRVSFPGGMFPMKSNNIPQGLGAAWFKLIDTKSGFPVLDCYVWDETTVWYHPRIGEQRDLENAIMKHVAEMISDVLQDESYLSGFEPNLRRRDQYRRAYVKMLEKRGKNNKQKNIFGF